MRRFVFVPAVLAGLGTGVATTSAESVDLQILHQAVSVDRSAGTANFWVTFNRPPEFMAFSEGFGDAFQYEVDADTTSLDASLGWSEVDAIIRGSEIWEGRGLPVRFRTGDGGGDNAGGWGPERAVLPFDLNGSTLTFSSPLEVLDATDGTFRYRAFTLQGGEINSQVVGAVIPMPAAFGPGLVLLGGLGAAIKLKRSRRRL